MPLEAAAGTKSDDAATCGKSDVLGFRLVDGRSEGTKLVGVIATSDPAPGVTGLKVAFAGAVAGDIDPEPDCTATIPEVLSRGSRDVDGSRLVEGV